MSRKKIMGLGIVGLFFWSGGGVGRAETPLASSLARDLSQISKVRSVEIHDDWMGLSDLGPLGKYYRLVPEGDHFSGKVVFSAGAYQSLKTKEEPLIIPIDVLQRFLSLLAQSPLDKGEYQPAITHTDDYPSRSIEVILESGKVSFFSKSQGEFAVPWGLNFGGEKYVVKAKNPAEALAQLKLYLKEEDFNQFTQELRAALCPTKIKKKH